jgi:predicted secreted hydrolase
MNNKMKIGIFVILLLGGIGIALLLERPADQISRTEIAFPAVVNDSSFIKAQPNPLLEFPKDHGSHDDYQTEWWYFTGNLSAKDGQEFGYQLTFFRRAIQPAENRSIRSSGWATEQVYLAHFTITNVSQNDFRFFERYSRGSAGLAGAVNTPFVEIWLEDWQVKQIDNGKFSLNAQQEEVTVDLVLQDGKNIVLQGENGYSQKGEQEGNASIYYSIPHLVSEGKLVWDNQEYFVEGLSWMDHEYSTSALSSQQVGWDWFAIHLSNGSELMVYNIRNSDGNLDAYSKGLLVFPDGSSTLLKKDEFTITSLKTWKSPHSAAEYPAKWRVEVPAWDVEITITPLVEDQELNVSFIYWEGAVSVEGKFQGEPVDGKGYVELTGYAQSMQGRF